jgi:hypothetical protein
MLEFLPKQSIFGVSINSMVDLTDAPRTHVRDVRERSEPLPDKFSSEANRCRPNFGERSHPLPDKFGVSGYMGLHAYESTRVWIKTHV